ncbi:MAG: tripartite tricarboxylate transporter TctB family protein [Spirochaetaceae bacterium]|nr:tripartite tricarboxylate transporter TctB family protein [Spirochaetaceae bacterium]
MFKTADMVCGIIGMMFSGGAFTMTLFFKKFKNVPVGPEFFPRWLAAGLFVCSAALFVQALKRPAAADKPAPTISPRNKGIRRLIAGIALIALYVFSWELAGFPLTTPLLLFALMFLLGMRRYPVMALFALGATAAIFCAFKFLLGIDMPLGLLENLL